MTTSFRYDKESIWAEFKSAKEKDIALSPKKTDNEVYSNRIKLLEEYIELEESTPEVFEDVSMNFKKLLAVYKTPDPRNTFYQSVFNKSYDAVRAESEVTTMADYNRSEYVSNTKDEMAEVKF